MEAMKLTPEVAKEILELGAVDGEFFCHQWFPKTFRDPSCEPHRAVWSALESGSRYVSVKLFRGAAKTTLLRAYAAKRVAYAESRTIFVVSSSLDHAVRSVRWLRKQVMFNRQWAGFYGLRLGGKKTDEWLEIENEIAGITISIIAVGISGQIRGVNLDDYRPDLIIVDDPDDEVSTNTPEQRKKMSKLFHGGLAKSLTPPTENPNALMVLLQTPLHEEDLISTCEKSSQWVSLSFSCFDENGESVWPERFPTKFLLNEKRHAAEIGEIGTWYREMECKIVGEASSAFQAKWLKEYPEGVTVESLMEKGAQAYMWIDPVPPPSPRQLANGLKDKDYEVLAVVLKYRGVVYLAEYAFNRGHEPDWTVTEFWRLVQKYRITLFGVEEVAYQRTLGWLLKQSMTKMQRYIPQYVPDKADRRKKSYRIIDTLKGITAMGQFYIRHAEHQEFVEQYVAYPEVSHDDIIEAVAEATRIALESLTIEGVAHSYDDTDEQIEMLGSCP